MTLKVLTFVMLTLTLAGCASSGQKKFAKEIREALEWSTRVNEPCNITCGKIKKLIEKYRLVK